MNDLIICRYDENWNIIFYCGTWKSNIQDNLSWTSDEKSATEFPIPSALDLLMVMNTVDTLNCWLRPKQSHLRSA